MNIQSVLYRLNYFCSQRPSTLLYFSTTPPPPNPNILLDILPSVLKLVVQKVAQHSPVSSHLGYHCTYSGHDTVIRVHSFLSIWCARLSRGVALKNRVIFTMQPRSLLQEDTTNPLERKQPTYNSNTHNQINNKRNKGTFLYIQCI